jgi:hypothetical protein
MHRFHYVAFVLVIGCVDPAQPETAEPDEVGSEDPEKFDYPTPPDDEGGLDIAAGFYNPSCDQALLEFELIDVTRPDGSIVATPECLWTFDDGQTSKSCTGSVVFAEPGVHSYTIQVRDPETDTVTSETGATIVYTPYVASFVASAPTCGLSIDVDADANLPSFLIVQVSPAENVVGDPFVIGTAAHSFQVTAEGTYTVELFAEDERQTGPICVIQQTLTVEVDDCKTPPPTCEATASAVQ